MKQSEAEFKDATKTWLVTFIIVFNVSRFKPALNRNRFLGGLRRGVLNSLNSDTGSSNRLKEMVEEKSTKSDLNTH